MMDDLKHMVETSKVPTKEDIIAQKKEFKKGANWILALMDLDAEDAVNSDLTPRQFANEFITKYRGML
jgi:hypothetical protein